MLTSAGLTEFCYTQLTDAFRSEMGYCALTIRTEPQGEPAPAVLGTAATSFAAREAKLVARPHEGTWDVVEARRCQWPAR